jgi:F-type H+-transporting ATPase subunit a
MVQFYGVQFLHLAYFAKYFNFSSPIMFFVGILELISEFAKIISFAFRLFGNVFAGEVLISVIMYLAGLGVPIPFYGLEVFVGFVQALVFSMLSLVFFNMATQGHSEHD